MIAADWRPVLPLIAEITVTRFSQTLLPYPEAEIEVSALLLDQ